ncbi:MAG: hypothetical protein DRO11_08085 [Methanobacteriota archaeon]|nr:MAG: hypothetical protein DRO11_08085 [Euryarchaeota archaeon]
MASGDKTIIASKSYVDSQIEGIPTNTAISTVASSVLLNQSSLTLDDFAITKNFAAVTYTGNGDTQDITTGISSVDFTVDNNGSGFWHDRDAGDCTVKNDAGDVVDEGSCVCNVSKIHVKCRSQAWYNLVFDSVRGAGKVVMTDDTQEESLNMGMLSNFIPSGFSLGSQAYVNADTETYIAYQTLYTHITWGKTNQDKKYIEAYNPVTRETIIMYEGSGNAGHEIPHSLGVELDMLMAKDLDAAVDWVAQIGDMTDTEKLVLNTDAAISSI